MDVSANACEDFYSFSCRHFVGGPENEVINAVRARTEEFKFFIEKELITSPHDPLCVINTIVGCNNAHNYYHSCASDGIKINGVINKINQEVSNSVTTNKYSLIRILVKNGITNFVHLTKEIISSEIRGFLKVSKTWAHYLRPGGNLFPEKDDVKTLYDKLGPKQTMTLAQFWSILPNTKLLFGPNALGEDILVIENLNYFRSLDDLLNTLEVEQVKDRLRNFVSRGLQFFASQSCLDQTKLLFPVTLCRSYVKLTERYNHNDEQFGADLVERISAAFGGNVGVPIRVGGCSSLLHSNNMADELIKFENVDMRGNFTFDNVHQLLFKQWYRIYDPVYLYFTYPRMLEFSETPLDWYTQTNAFYDPFHNEIIIPPGIIQFPIYEYHYKDYVKFSRLGFLIAHEIALSSVENSTVADKLALETLLKLIVHKCEFFISFAQLFCTIFDENKRTRVNNVIHSMGENEMKAFKACFNVYC